MGRSIQVMTPPPPHHPAPVFDLFNVLFEQIYDPAMTVVLSFDAQVDEDILKTATMRLIGSNPYIRSRFAVVDGQPVWEEIGEEEWGGAFVLHSGGSNAPPPAVLPQPPDVRAGPQIRVTVYRGTGGDTICVTCHHGFCDAKGVLTMAEDLCLVYRGVMQDPGFCPPSTGCYDRTTDRVLSLFTKEECRLAIAEEEPFIDRWHFPAEWVGRGTQRAAYRTLPADRLARIRAIAKEYGATVNDVLIAGFFLAFLAIRDDPADRGAPRGILTSADMRRLLPGKERLPPMNLSVAFEVTLEVEAGAGLLDILPEVTALMKNRKDGRIGPGCIYFYDKIYAGGMDSVEAFFDGMIDRYRTDGEKNPVFANLGIISPDDYLPMPGKDGTALSLERFHFIPCICWPYGFLVVAYTFRGELTLMTAYEEGPYSTKTVERFLEYMDGYLA